MNPFLIMSYIIKLVNLYEFIIFARIILSFINHNPYNPVIQWIFRLTDPVMNFIRRYIPCQIGMIDFSPMIIIILLHLMVTAIQNLLIILL